MMSALLESSGSPRFLAGGGEMGSLLREHDWGGSALGNPENWPQSLKTAISIMLTSRQPIWIGWGRELTFFYNDAYKAIIGGRHPWALARPTSEVWRELWAEIGPMLATAMGGTEGTYVEEQILIMERNGYPEETYYTFSYSPIPDDAGNAGGIICANTDDTKRVIGERQLTLLRELSARTAGIRSVKEVCVAAAAALATNPQDLPFTLIYLEQGDSATLHRVGSAGISESHAAAPPSMTLDCLKPWPLAEAFRNHGVHVVTDLAGNFSKPLPTGAWHDAVAQVAILPIVPGSESARRGCLIVGLNPFRIFDGDYRDFLRLLTGQVAAAVANADAYEQERLRAESLAEIDRAKTAFFSNVSHEFRTPLTLMLGPLEEALAEADVLPPQERERVAVVHRNAMRLLKLVNSLLDFSRIEAGAARASFEPIDLAALTIDLAGNFRSATQKAGLKLVIDCPRLTELVYVDRHMWEKIVLNLLSNAFKFTFKGSINVTMRQHGAIAELAVADTGTGIATSEMPRLFERFHRIEGAPGRSFEGSGIGLALVKELAEQLGGSIHAESRKGSGTTFYVNVPLGIAHVPAGQLQEDSSHITTAVYARAFVEEALRWLPESVPPTNAAAKQIDAQPRARILLADDNADMRDYVARLLEARHDCVAMPDGQAALEAIRAQRPDLVLTDMMMPRLDGFGLIRAIRADAELRDLPVIVISARAGEESSVEGLDAGADDYLIKPFSARELLARVGSALAMARVRREMGDALREEARSLDILNKVGAAVAAELDLRRVVQVVTDAATELTGAAFGSFLYNLLDESGERRLSSAQSGAPRPDSQASLLPRHAPGSGFAPLPGQVITRVDDVLLHPEYSETEPPLGMPRDLVVRSYLTAPVVSRSGEVLGALYFGHPDTGAFTARAERLTAGIAAQAAIAIDNARLYQSMGRLVVERTAALETANRELRAEAHEREKIEQALRQSQKMEAVGKLTGGIAHDFNNLLQVIGGNLQLLAKDVAGSDKAEQRLRNALAGVSRGSKLASQLLSFGRRQPLAPKVVNLGRFIRGLDDLLRRALGDGVEIESIIADDLWNTLVDISQVENAVLNLAINARDAMNEHGKLTLAAGNIVLSEEYAAQHADGVPGEYVMLSVADTGCGMTPEVMEHVFEPFFTTKPEGRGTGLGLSMVYGFVKQSDGHVKIHSEPNRGTTIRIYLPRARGAEDVSQEVEAGPVAGGSEAVLVVEDDEEVRATVVELLTDLGYRVLKARDAQNALAIVESGAAIDLLFTDVVMPGPVRSTDLARQARLRLPDVAVLFTSGYTDDAIVHDGRLDRGIALLSKPYTREALARKVRHVLRNQQQKRPAVFHPRTASRSLNILFVEDDELIRLSTLDMLTGLGHRVFPAGDAREALELLDENSVDVLMTDLDLPGMLGGRLAVEIHRLRPAIKIVFATGADGVSHLEGELPSDSVVTLHKPYDVGALQSALWTIGERRNVR